MNKNSALDDKLHQLSEKTLDLLVKQPTLLGSFGAGLAHGLGHTVDIVPYLLGAGVTTYGLGEGVLSSRRPSIKYVGSTQLAGLTLTKFSREKPVQEGILAATTLTGASAVLYGLGYLAANIYK